MKTTTIIAATLAMLVGGPLVASASETNSAVVTAYRATAQQPGGLYTRTGVASSAAVRRPLRAPSWAASQWADAEPVQLRLIGLIRPTDGSPIGRRTRSIPSRSAKWPLPSRPSHDRPVKQFTDR